MKKLREIVPLKKIKQIQKIEPGVQSYSGMEALLENAGLVVAAKHNKTGKIITGKPGDTHADLMDMSSHTQLHKAWDELYDNNELGFATKEGKFLNRKEAMIHARKNKLLGKKGSKWSDAKPTDTELDSLNLRNESFVTEITTRLALKYINKAQDKSDRLFDPDRSDSRTKAFSLAQRKIGMYSNFKYKPKVRATKEEK